MFRDQMKVAAIPERIYALCCAVRKKDCDRLVLKNRFEPEEISSTSYFGEVLAAAKQLNLVSEQENIISLIIDPGILDSMVTFRQYVAPIALSLKDSLFYHVTKAYLEMNEKIFEFNNISKMYTVIQEKVPKQFNVYEMDLRAWRFWAAFTGLGMLHDMVFIPNMYQYLKDIITLSSIEVNKEYTVRDFFGLISDQLGFALPQDENALCMGISNGLRQLHDEKIIELKQVLDSSDVWFLYRMEEHEYQRSITHITRRQ